MLSEPTESEIVHWRQGPCADCAGGATLLDFIVGRHEASGTGSSSSPDDIIEELTARERPWLIEWVESCLHTKWEYTSLPNLDEGSEHIVYLAPGGNDVFKLTKPDLYGDTYFLSEGRVHQPAPRRTRGGTALQSFRGTRAIGGESAGRRFQHAGRVRYQAPHLRLAAFPKVG
jgi:hypothetical protein